MTTLSKNAVLPAAPPLDENRLAWLALALAPGLGPKRILDAMKELDAPSQVFSLPLTALEGLRFPAEAAQFIFDGKARCGSGARRVCFPGQPSPWWARGTLLHMARAWRRCSRATWP
jgi:hypothetical protein